MSNDTNVRAIEPLPMDVLFGRGKMNALNPGNLRFQELIKSRQATYDALSNKKKRLFVQDIMHNIQGTGRFLQKKEDETWFVASSSTIQNKIAHALQYHIRKGNTIEPNQTLLSPSNDDIVGQQHIDSTYIVPLSEANYMEHIPTMEVAKKASYFTNQNVFPLLSNEVRMTRSAERQLHSFTNTDNDLCMLPKKTSRKRLRATVSEKISTGLNAEYLCSNSDDACTASQQNRTTLSAEDFYKTRTNHSKVETEIYRCNTPSDDDGKMPAQIPYLDTPIVIDASHQSTVMNSCPSKKMKKEFSHEGKF